MAVSLNTDVASVNNYTTDTAAAASKATAADTSKTENTQNSVGAVYEKSSENTDTSKLYKINKMSEEDRAALVQKLKEEDAKRKSDMLNIVMNAVNGQGKAVAIATDDDSIWSKIASGDFEVDEATRKQAEEDISEDGYWGVKQTSQRLFDFASALAGDDVDKMKEMQDAMLEGFKQAEKTWGRELPEISQKTLDAANKLFDDYYASKSSEGTSAATADVTAVQS